MARVSAGAVVANGLAFDPKTPMSDPNVRAAVTALFDELEKANLRYLLVGGVAVLAFVEGRNTQDIDLIVAPGDAEAFFSDAVLSDRDFGQASFRGVRVDLLLTSNPLFREVLERDRQTVSIDGRDVPTATPDGLVLLKLYALPSLYRQGKLDRAALYETDVLMLRRGATDDAALLARLAPHVSATDLAELQRILAEQRTRRRFRTNDTEE